MIRRTRKRESWSVPQVIMKQHIRSTTVIAVKKGKQVAIAGDGQVSLNQTILKAKANKIRKIFDGKVVVGFAGSTADALTLFEKFEDRLKEFSGKLLKASVELVKDWRTDRALRRLEALLIVANNENLLILSGNGDVIEPDDGIATIGSGGSYALAAARALLRNTKLSPKEIVTQAIGIAGEICVYTNNEINVEEINL